MAKQGLTSFKWKRKGYQEVQNSAPVQDILRQQAGWKQGNANARYGKNVYYANPVKGRFARGYVVGVQVGKGKRVFEDKAKREQILRSQL